MDEAPRQNQIEQVQPEQADIAVTDSDEDYNNDGRK
jgi:hypothetical protein